MLGRDQCLASFEQCFRRLQLDRVDEARYWGDMIQQSDFCPHARFVLLSDVRHHQITDALGSLGAREKDFGDSALTASLLPTMLSMVERNSPSVISRLCEETHFHRLRLGLALRSSTTS